MIEKDEDGPPPALPPRGIPPRESGGTITRSSGLAGAGDQEGDGERTLVVRKVSCFTLVIVFVIRYDFMIFHQSRSLSMLLFILGFTSIRENLG